MEPHTFFFHLSRETPVATVTIIRHRAEGNVFATVTTTFEDRPHTTLVSYLQVYKVGKGGQTHLEMQEVWTGETEAIYRFEELDLTKYW